MFPCILEMLTFSPCNPKFFAVRHIHYPVNPSRDHFYTNVVLPPSDHYCIETVAPSGDHYCIDVVVPSSDHCCAETLLPSSDNYGTTKVAPPSDHLHTKITQQRKLIAEKIHQKFGGMTPVAPLATPLLSAYREFAHKNYYYILSMQDPTSPHWNV